MTKEQINSVQSIIENKGEFFKSRRSVTSPYRLGLRFKNIDERDEYVLRVFFDSMGQKMKLNPTKSVGKKGRVISNQFITKLQSVEYVSPILNKKIKEDGVFKDILKGSK